MICHLMSLPTPRCILLLFHFHVSMDKNPSYLKMDLLTLSSSTDRALMILKFARTRVDATLFNFLRDKMKKVTSPMVSLEGH
jgi:hypothetical protein